MKKLYIILFVMILLACSLSSAVDIDDSDLLAYWNFDEASGNVIDRKTNTITKFDLSSNINLRRQLPIAEDGFSVTLNGTNEYMNNTAIVSLLNTYNTHITWIAWANPVYVGDRAIISNREGTNGFYLGAAWDASGTVQCLTFTAGGIKFVDGQGEHFQGTMFTCRFNETGLSLWFNDTVKTEISFASTTILANTEDFDIGRLEAGRFFDGGIDEVMIFNRSLNASDIADIYNNGLEGVPIITAAPTFVFPSIDNQRNNTNITINITHNSDGLEITYYVNITGTRKWANVAPNQTTDEFSSFIWFTDLPDGTYVINASVKNTTSGLFSSIITRTFIIDTTNPIITLNGDNSFDTNSVSRISQYLNYLFLSINFTDNAGLFGVVINITKDAKSYFNYSNISFGVGIGNLTFNFTRNVSTSSWPSGVFNVNISASDSHTTNSIGDYEINPGINTARFDTPEGNRIWISSDGSAYRTIANKKKERYEFGWDYLFKDSTRKFTLEANSKIYYLPDSKYKAHFVVMGSNLNGNWIDFEGIGNDYSVKKISDTKYEITFTNLALTNQIISKSLGGVNKVTETFSWYKGNHTTTAPTKSTFRQSETFTLNITKNDTFALPNATLNFNGTLHNPIITTFSDYIIFSKDIIIPQPSEVSQILPYFWSVNINQSLNGSYNFSISNSINVTESLIDNCSVHNNTILVISGRDEETNLNITMELNILFIPSFGVNNSFELSGKSNYSFCSDSNENFTIDSIMEYGDATIYTDRKYYLNNFIIDSTTRSDVFLFHLNETKASEIVFTVFDATTGDRIRDAFIKILRFYPGEEVFRVVEIAKTDEVGQSLGKMVLADVFYKFIIEVPAGTVKLDTGVLKILSLTRSFGISFVEDVLDTWDKIHGVSTSVTCTKGTQTCRLTWSDESNIVQDATLEVWRTTGLTNTLIFSQTTTASSGTISHTITEDTATNTYVAKGFIESNTGTSLYGVGVSSFFFSDNPFFTDPNQRLAALFPLFLLVVVIVFAFIDFGVIGITIGALLGLITGSIVGILPIDPFYLISFILIGGILIYKLSK